MARRSNAEALAVFLNAKPVGRLTRTASGAVAFSYDASWLDWSGSMPVSISLPLTGEVFRGAPVINVFENLLPDAAQIRRHLAERLGAGGTDAFSLLSVAGRDCVGALQFLPDGEAPEPAGEVRGEVMTEAEIAALIRRLRVAPLGMDREDEDFRISIAGAQDKTALLKIGEQWKRPAGTTATTHILKPAIGVLHNGFDLADSVQNEFLCLKLCSAFGLEVAEASIEKFEDQLVLSVTRFDRLWTEDGRLLRLPQEDFCQALSVPSTLKYQRDGGPSVLNILERLKESDRPAEDRRNFLKAQMVFWLLGATDGHAKNFSIAHRPGGGFKLTPLYDILSAQPLADGGKLRRNRFRMAMSIGANNHYRMDEIQVRHFKETADTAGLPVGTVEEICGELERGIPIVLDELASSVGNLIPAALVESLSAGVRSRKQILGMD
ncbi:type II toxin-antitoxin system HipA family toxin [Hyphomonas sp.]|uniref:type II toxin-antitoxin system HipA family toxin n=1 Tax=Hyphomonas sp. TaxID=87 RepID=UPI0025C3E483|nr:type II toxin-antitoxin system HipA family toxin [Hyphomonas sp.]MBI1399639.1 type II toxin-antitoxin system HipA family toxin [Hyphomonas sp.]